MRMIKYLIVHCTDSDDSLDLGAREIKHLHTAPMTEAIDWSGYKTHGRGWSDIGYHFVVRRDGTLEKGRPLEQRGAHVKGWNRKSIGIVWVGRKEIMKDQYHTLLSVLRGMMNMYGISIDNVLGHGEIDHLKTCPNISMMRLRADLLFLSGEDMAEGVKKVMKLEKG